MDKTQDPKLAELYLSEPHFAGATQQFALPAAMAVSSDSHDPLTERIYFEPSHPYRTPFVRDCGRILHAKAFRRLAGKTQVFTRQNRDTDHSRSRLTHTLEVAQIARNTAVTLGLNAPLAEALALVHDIGHPPFGHAGEKALNIALQAHGLSFDHNLHALRIVTSFEERYAAFRGLNLTLAIREGIIKHSRDYDPEVHPELAEYFLDRQAPVEAQLIDLADEIAYLSADFEDGLAAGILDLDTVRAEVPIFTLHFTRAQEQFPSAPLQMLANEATKQVLNAFVTDLIEETARETEALALETLDDVRRAPRRIAHLSPAMEAHRHQAKSFLYAHLYQSANMEAQNAHSAEVVSDLFAAWTADSSLLPPDHQRNVELEGAPRAVADYIAGMTDAYIEHAWLRHHDHQE